jgi:hypothetical protein
MTTPITVVFDAYHLYHLPQFDPVIDLLKTDPRFRVVLTTSAEIEPQERELTQNILQQRGCETLFSGDEEERARRIRSLPPDWFICGWSRYRLRRFVPDSTWVGMIYHGIGVKPSYWRDNHQRLDIRFVEGPFRERQLRAKGVTTELVVTGFAKLDPLFNNQVPGRDQTLQSLGLDPERKTVLYAPTFYPSSLEKFGMLLGEQTRDYNVIIKPHLWVYFLDRFGDANLKPQRRLLTRLRERYPHLRVLEPHQYNIVPYYQAADVLITEASSTIYEMMALDKPVIRCRFFKLRWNHWLFRHRLYRRRLDAGMSQEMTRFCIELPHPAALAETLEKAFQQYDPNPELREQYKRDMLFRLDGMAAERIRAVLLSRTMADKRTTATVDE